MFPVSSALGWVPSWTRHRPVLGNLYGRLSLLKKRVLLPEQHGQPAWEAIELIVNRERGGPRDTKSMVGSLPSAVRDQAIVMQLLDGS